LTKNQTIRYRHNTLNSWTNWGLNSQQTHKKETQKSYSINPSKGIELTSKTKPETTAIHTAKQTPQTDQTVIREPRKERTFC